MDKKAMAEIIRGIEGGSKDIVFRIGAAGKESCQSQEVSFDEGSGLVTIKKNGSISFIPCESIYYVRVEPSVDAPEFKVSTELERRKEKHSLDKRDEAERRIHSLFARRRGHGTPLTPDEDRLLDEHVASRRESPQGDLGVKAAPSWDDCSPGFDF